jgi:hypothetical protein
VRTGVPDLSHSTYIVYDLVCNGLTHVPPHGVTGIEIQYDYRYDQQFTVQDTLSTIPQFCSEQYAPYYAEPAELDIS